MIKIPKDQLTEFYGFTVYDADSGEPCGGDDDFMLNQNGSLYKITDGYWEPNIDGEKVPCAEVEYVPKTGKYLIQFADGMFMRW